MGLIKCPDCNKQFSDRIDNCPFCGCPKEEAIKEQISHNSDYQIEPQQQKESVESLSLTKFTPKKSSIAIVLILMLLVFSNLMHPYIENEATYDFAFLYGWIEMALRMLFLMPIPILYVLKAKNITKVAIHRVCLFNSIIVWVIALVFSIILDQNLLGWLTALCFYFINKHILLMSCGFVERNLQKKQKITYIFIMLFVVILLTGAGCYFVVNRTLEESLSIQREETNSKYFVVEDGVIIDYDSAGPKNVVIPSEIDGQIITEIGESAFYNKGIESVKFPNTLKKIRKQSFADNNLSEVYIPDSVIKIYSSAFMSNRIKKVTLGKKVNLIGAWSFDFNNLKEVEIPDSVKTINQEAFANNSLTKVIIGKNVETIEFAAFGIYDGIGFVDVGQEYNQQLKKIINKSGNSFDWYDVLAFDLQADGTEMWLVTGSVDGPYGKIKISK